jgi:hypothetical protein
MTEPQTPIAAVTTPRTARLVRAIAGAIVTLAVIALLAIALLGSDGDQAGADLASEARENRVQAVYLSNDQVLFGTLEARDGAWVELLDAYSLRNEPAAEGEDPAEQGSRLQVVPANATVGGDGNVVINAEEVVLLQNLAADSDIARAVEDARE